MDCINCKKTFDLEERIPWLLLCGHPICQLCNDKSDGDGIVCRECSTCTGKALTYDHYRIGCIFTKGYAPITLKKEKSLIENTLFCPEHPKTVVHYVDEEDSQFICADCVLENDLSLEDTQIVPLEKVNKSKFSELEDVIKDINVYKESLPTREKDSYFENMIDKEFLEAHSVIQVKRVKTHLMMKEQNPVLRVLKEISTSAAFMQTSGGVPESGFVYKILDVAKNTIPSEDQTSVERKPPFLSIEISEPQINVSHNLNDYYSTDDDQASPFDLQTGDQVYVVHVKTPSSLCVRRVQDGVKFVELSNKIGSSIRNEGVINVKEGNIYAYNNNGVWFRVMVLNYRSDMPKVRAIYMDTGEEEFLRIDALRILQDAKAVQSIPPLIMQISLSTSKDCRFQKDQLEQFIQIVRPSSSCIYWIDHVEGDDPSEFDLLFMGKNGSLNSLRDVCVQQKILNYKNIYSSNGPLNPKKRIPWNKTDYLEYASTESNETKKNNSKQRKIRKKNPHISSDKKGKKPTKKTNNTKSFQI